MRPSLCRSCLASLLKLLAFLQTFVGVSIILYSAWVLIHLRRDKLGDEFGFDLDKLPAPWFVCALMGIGILVCLIAFTGHVAAEAVSRCCLCSYAVFTMVLILLEAVLVGDIMFNKHWEEDLPYDSTGQLKKLRAFIKDNLDIFESVAVTIIVIQVLSLLLAMVLRSMVPRRRLDYDSDEDFVVIRRPLLNPQSGSNFTPTTIHGNGYHSDIWSSQMRQKVRMQFRVRVMGYSFGQVFEEKQTYSESGMFLSKLKHVYFGSSWSLFGYKLVNTYT